MAGRDARRGRRGLRDRGAKVGEKIETVVQRAVGVGVGAVDLVDHDDGAQAEGEGFGGDEFRLRHGAFGGVDEQADAVDHAQDAFDLTAEIGVAGRVDDVDARAVPFDGGAFGQDRDPAFAFYIIGIHRSFSNLLVFAEGARLPEKLVHEGRLAVVDVRDDRDVADVHDALLPGVERPIACNRDDGKGPLLTFGITSVLRRYCVGASVERRLTIADQRRSRYWWHHVSIAWPYCRWNRLAGAAPLAPLALTPGVFRQTRQRRWLARSPPRGGAGQPAKARPRYSSTFSR